MKSVKKCIHLVRNFFNWLFFGQSLLSYIAFIIFSFILVKYVIFPVIYKVFNLTDITAVLSSSMVHGENVNYTFYNYLIKAGYSMEEIKSWPFQDGLNVGDIVFVRKEPINVGDVIVYKCVWEGCPKGTIIHRVINITYVNGKKYYWTKGDANLYQLYFERNITDEIIVGKAIVKIPYLGYPRVFLYYLFRI